MSGTPGDGFGVSVSGVGDVDGDGMPDFAAGATAGTGYVQVFSGASGTMLLTIPSGFGNSDFGRTICEAGDLNGDGIGDILIGDPGFGTGGTADGFAGVFSGANGALLLPIPSPFPGLPSVPTSWGLTMDLMGDIDGDGLPDYLVGAPFSDPTGTGNNANQGHAAVVSGATGAPFPGYLYTGVYAGGVAGEEFGTAVANAGDVDADGTDDFIISALQSNAGLPGYIQVYSGATGSPLGGGVNGSSPGDFFGAVVDGAGDINGDGFADVIVGESSKMTVFSGASLLTGGPAIVIFSAANGGGSGFTGVGIGDVDLDGVPDLLAAEKNGSDPLVVVMYSGAGGTELYRKAIDGFPSIAYITIDSMGDLNGDGCADYIIGAPGYDVARVFNGLGSAYNYGPSSPHSGSPLGAQMSFTGYAGVAQNQFGLEVLNAPPQTAGIFIMAPEQTFYPFDDGFMLLQGGVTRLSGTVTDSAGGATMALDFTSLPPGISIVGASEWNFQFWFRDLGSSNLSDGLSVMFAP